jgi:hypothetical protein
VRRVDRLLGLLLLRFGLRLLRRRLVDGRGLREDRLLRLQRHLGERHVESRVAGLEPRGAQHPVEQLIEVAGHLLRALARPDVQRLRGALCLLQ